MSHATVVKNYATRKINSRHGQVEWHGSRIFARDKIIYSYGSHFPMAVYLGKKKGGHFFVKNGDRYSSSTSGHQSHVQHCCKGPTVSRTALRAAGITFTDLEFGNIVSWQADYTEYIERDKDGVFWKGWGDNKVRFTPPKQGMFMPHSSQKDAEVTTGYWHILGAVVLKHDDSYYLASLDEGQYFIAELPAKPKSVDHAFALLKPKEVLKAERAGIQVIRQGEWFFVPTGMSHDDFIKFIEPSTGIKTRTALFDLAKPSPLPLRPLPNNENEFASGRRNMHVCRHVMVLNEGIFATGRVYHRNTATKMSTGEHRTLHLGETWYKVYLNKELASWTTGGRVD